MCDVFLIVMLLEGESCFVYIKNKQCYLLSLKTSLNFLGQTSNVLDTEVTCIECFKVPATYERIILLLMAWFSSGHLRKITNIFLQMLLVYNQKFF